MKNCRHFVKLFNSSGAKVQKSKRVPTTRKLRRNTCKKTKLPSELSDESITCTSYTNPNWENISSSFTWIIKNDNCCSVEHHFCPYYKTKHIIQKEIPSCTTSFSSCLEMLVTYRFTSFLWGRKNSISSTDESAMFVLNFPRAPVPAYRPISQRYFGSKVACDVAIIWWYQRLWRRIG